MQFYYHPDHLGSSSYITNLDGEVMQHIEYVPFGEVFIEERNNTWNTPYLFNAKEFDEETGMYYYGARYYEPRLSLWMSVDPISNYDPRNNENYLDGEHNGGIYNSYNLYSYGYCYQSPIRLIDPNGKQVDAIDFVPFVGSGRDIYRGIRGGDFLTGTIGVVGLIADVATLGSGSAVKGGLKGGLKALMKTELKTEAKAVTKAADKTIVKGLSNKKIVQKAADKANRAIRGYGPVVGTKKHEYASKLIERYQKINGDKGLNVKEYFDNGVGNRGFLDVHDVQNNVIYDFKFGINPRMGQKQIGKYSRNFPGNRVEPVIRKVNRQ